MNTDHDVYLYILVMTSVTYLTRLLPSILTKKETRNVYIKSLLYYVSYVTLSVTILPAILHVTVSAWPGAAALSVAVIPARKDKSLFLVSLAAYATIPLLELSL